MPRFAIALALLGIAGFFVSVESILHPEIFTVAEKAVYEEKSQNKQTQEKNFDLELPQETDVPRAENYFPVSALSDSGIRLYQGRFSLALFQHAPITASRDSFYLATFAFQIDGKPIGTVSRVMPTFEVSSGRLLSLVRQKLMSVIPSDQKDSLFLSDPLKTIGEANFYLNDQKSFPTTIFLVVRSQTKVLAFEYQSEYHESVKKLIPLFFNNGEESYESYKTANTRRKSDSGTACWSGTWCRRGSDTGFLQTV